MEPGKRCSECGSALEYRLGMLECPGCGYSEDKLPAEPPPVEGGASKPPRERAREYRESTHREAPSEQSSWLPPPPQDSELARFMVGRPEQPETTYITLYPSLPLEKRVIIWLIGLPQVLGIVFLIYTLGTLRSMTSGFDLPPDPALESGLAAVNLVVAGMIVSTLIYIGVVYAALFLDFIPLKWGCGGCTVILAIIAAGSFLFPNASDYEGYGSGYNVAWAMLVKLATVALWVWLVSIFFRDLRERGSL